MKTAFAVWNNRIAPVFDESRLICLVEIESGNIVDQRHERLPVELPSQKALCLVELGVQTLVCGAISRPMQDMITSYGIRLISFIAGDLQEVIQAYLSGRLTQTPAFAMPGCRICR